MTVIDMRSIQPLDGMRTFSSRISSAENDTGRSMAKMESTCSKSIVQRRSQPASVPNWKYFRALTVLQDITNDAELIEIPAPALSTKWLLEGNLDVADGVFVPGR